MQINLFIISFNRLTFLKQQLEFLMKEKRVKVTIIDNHSTYRPLLDYLHELQAQGVGVYFCKENHGHTVVWDLLLSKERQLNFNVGDNPYIVTDSDIIPCKENWLDTLLAGLEMFPEVNKVGLGLRTSDLPNKIAFRNQIIQHETILLYRKPTKDARFVYMAVDTTLAIYRPGYHDYSVWGHDSNEWNGRCQAIRTTFPMDARHMSWYITPEDLKNEENQFYLNSIRAPFTHWSAKQKDLK